MTTVAAPGDSLVAQFVSVDLDLLKETRLSRMLTSFIHSAHYRWVSPRQNNRSLPLEKKLKIQLNLALSQMKEGILKG